MTLQSSGAISLLDVQNEFGGSNPIGINEYYGVASGVPTSGTISLSNFYGKSSFSWTTPNTLGYKYTTSTTTNTDSFTGITVSPSTSATLSITLQPSTGVWANSSTVVNLYYYKAGSLINTWTATYTSGRVTTTYTVTPGGSSIRFDSYVLDSNPYTLFSAYSSIQYSSTTVFFHGLDYNPNGYT